MILAGNVITDAFKEPTAFQSILIWANVALLLAIAIGLAIYVYGRRARAKTAQNLEPFFEDDKLEGPKLERTLGIALMVAAIIAIAIPVYFAWEPHRQAAEANGFIDRSVSRGAVLYANAQMPQYNSAASLQCANCHGAVVKNEKTGKLEGAGGGVANYVVKPTRENCTAEEQQTDPACRTTTVAWKAPALNTVLLKYPKDQVLNILVYGRPGSPMPAWGVAGGGSKNDQALNDLVDFLYSIQLTPEQARAQTAANADIASFIEGPANPTTGVRSGGVNDQLKDAQANVAKAQAAIAAANTPAAKATAEQDLTFANAAVAHLQERKAKLEQLAGDIASGDADRATKAKGQLLFETNCARCHTRGWSYYTPGDGRIPLPAPEGSGAFGPSLTGNSTIVQFPDPKSMAKFVYEGAVLNKPYGVRGVGSGQMPGFGVVMTEEQINQVVTYEREGLRFVTPVTPGYASLKGAAQ
ncbi:MAG: c-type cytochrome [Acidimicrobiia bacterium]